MASASYPLGAGSSSADTSWRATPHFGRAIRHYRRSALILAITTFLAVGAFFATRSSIAGTDPALDTDVLGLTIRGVSGWLWIVTIMGYAAGTRTAKPATPGPTRLPTRIGSVGTYTSEAVLPVYVLHQTVIVLLAFYIVQWHVNATIEYLIISMASLLIILAIYDLAVRRAKPTRFLFGAKPPPRTPRT